jgi:hypothetical protein
MKDCLEKVEHLMKKPFTLKLYMLLGILQKFGENEDLFIRKGNKFLDALKY